MNRIAQETLEILKTGSYTSPSGISVDISGKIKHSEEKSRYYTPVELER